MIETCFVHNSNNCSRINEINLYKKSSNVLIAYGFDWNVESDNIALVYADIYKKQLQPVARKLGIELEFESLGGKKSGSIYCNICCQIQKSDIAIFDLSTNNINVIFELGLAVGSGAYVYVLRSKHQKTPKKQLSDLNGILEYRFTRRNGLLNFNGYFVEDIISTLGLIAKKKNLG